MNKWGATSHREFLTLHADLQVVMTMVLVEIDLAILCGHRNEAKQNDYFEKELSKTKWPNSEHNYYPSRAVDAVPPPFPVDWNAKRRFDYFGGYVVSMAHSVGIGIRWGGDWDRDHDPTDQWFNDLIHFELWPHRLERPDSEFIRNERSI